MTGLIGTFIFVVVFSFLAPFIFIIPVIFAIIFIIDSIFYSATESKRNILKIILIFSFMVFFLTSFGFLAILSYDSLISGYGIIAILFELVLFFAMIGWRKNKKMKLTIALSIITLTLIIIYSYSLDKKETQQEIQKNMVYGINCEIEKNLGPDYCYKDVAETHKDVSMCNKIKNSLTKTICIAELTGNIEVCRAVQDPDALRKLRDNCLLGIVKFTNPDPIICTYMNTDWVIKECNDIVKEK